MGCEVQLQLRIGKNSDRDFTRTFNRSLIILVVPIALQSLITAVINLIDVLMLGFIDQSAMAAVSLAAQVTFVLTLFYTGLATGTGILTAQYWGKNDVKAIQSVLSISLMCSICISFLFFGLSLFFPEQLMYIFTDDNELVRYGTNYLRVISFSYLAIGLSQMYFSVVKSMENARISATISSICLLLNIVLNAICIFILFPSMPEKAISGVAAATVCVRFIELGCCILHSKARGQVHFHLPFYKFLDKNLFKDFLKYTVPILGNFIVWGGALTATTTIIGHVSVDMVASNSIATVVKDLVIILCAGIASGGSVLVGKYLGNNDLEKARKAGNRIICYAFLFGLIAGASILLIKPLIFTFMNLNDEAQGYLNGMLYICTFYCIGKSVNSTIIGGIFPAGGDTKFGFWCDLIVMWFIILPLGFISAFFWQVHPIILYAIISLDEIIKLPVAIIRYIKYRWLNNITRELPTNK